MSLKQDFIDWRSSKVNEQLLPEHPLIDVCLDAVIESASKSTINDVQFQSYYPHQKQMELILEDWKSNVSSLLRHANEIVGIHFRDVLVPHGSNAQELLDSFLQYIDLLESSM
ncbi:MAG: hypothetical protein M9916_02050 [Crocinitomicaceae bacterium]|jgi:hypothetical protein|nr:hypothetical protein [Crocinitomicaceae bacterium]